MRLKPKSTVHNPRALLYKRFTDLETSIASGRVVLYQTEDGKLWEFSSEMVKFLEYTGNTDGKTPILVGGDNFHSILKYKNAYFIYYNDKWNYISKTENSTATELSAEFEGSSLILDETEDITGFIPKTPFPNTLEVTTSRRAKRIVVVVSDFLGNGAIYIKVWDGTTYLDGTVTLNKAGEFKGVQDRKNKIQVVAETVEFTVRQRLENSSPITINIKYISDDDTEVDYITLSVGYDGYTQFVADTDYNFYYNDGQNHPAVLFGEYNGVLYRYENLPVANGKVLDPNGEEWNFSESENELLTIWFGREVYSITVNTENCRCLSPAEKMFSDESKVFDFVVDEGYELPESITVTNANYTWHKDGSWLEIENPVGDVTITVVAQAVQL